MVTYYSQESQSTFLFLFFYVMVYDRDKGGINEFFALKKPQIDKIMEHRKNHRC